MMTWNVMIGMSMHMFVQGLTDTKGGQIFIGGFTAKV
jgi:hypothetical protein